TFGSLLKINCLAFKAGFGQDPAVGRLSALSHSLLILLLGCVCSGWTQVQSADLQRLESEIREALEQSGIPGAGIALVRNGDVLWAGGVGLADRSSSRPVSGQTLYPLGSISKTFVGMAVVRLNQEGKLDLQEPVRKLIPEVEFQNRWENTDPVRLIHLLEHTSGIDDLRFAELFRDGRTIARSGPRRVRWQPGTFFSYSSVGSNVAAEIVERVTGLKFDDYVRTHFFDPLQMSSSSFSLEFDMQGSLATGYAADGKTPVPFQPIPFRPSGSLVSTPADMARF